MQLSASSSTPDRAQSAATQDARQLGLHADVGRRAFRATVPRPAPQRGIPAANLQPQDPNVDPHHPRRRGSGSRAPFAQSGRRSSNWILKIHQGDGPMSGLAYLAGTALLDRE